MWAKLLRYELREVSVSHDMPEATNSILILLRWIPLLIYQICMAFNPFMVLRLILNLIK